MRIKEFNFGIDKLSVGLALEIARSERIGRLSSETIKKVTGSRQAVEKIVRDGKIVYGINTGFGSLCTTLISEEDTQKLQHNILRSHSVGMGENIPDEVAMLMLVLKIHALAQGFSGVALTTLERILWHIDNKIIPVVPSQGSVGASGDLAPLAHLFLPLIGLGEVIYKGKKVETAAVLQAENMEPLQLGPKEGLALINGTQFMAAYAIKAVERMHNCLETADIIGAMTLESMLGSVKPFEEKLHQLRAYEGNLHVAHRLRVMLEKSEMVHSHQNCQRVQDPYSLRCMPQVHGASRNAWLHLKDTTTTEINSVTDNPIIFDENNTISGGNFHGQPIALPLDYAVLAISELGNISDRRTFLLLEGAVGGLPKLLMKNTGINSGFMMPQYTSAALVTENKSLCFPASADSIPTSLGQEDHVSMGAISGRRTGQVLDNLEKILAVELLCAAQAFDYRRPLKSSKILESCHQLIRKHIDHAEEDRVFSRDLEIARELIANKSLAQVANKAAVKDNIKFKGESDEYFGIY
ncbi:MAG: histidine ammonia-lyase [Calditrichaeota bacterium]|nr:MAG: histidine ammonia-lyase [Calditrichota bacterium]